MKQPIPYKRILLKLSGEALLGGKEFGLDLKTISKITSDIAQVVALGIEVGIVIGGGNIFRGVSGATNGMDRSSADYVGMMATVINALVVQDLLEKEGIKTRVLSAIPMQTVCEPYIRRRAIRHIEKKRVVIFAAGTGNPFFTTDTAATLRAIEIGADVLFKATQVDGVYDSDPKRNPDAVRFDSISFQEVLTKGLKVMDASAIALASDNKLPIVVFNIHQDNAFLRATRLDCAHTLIQ